jgi:DNA repair protein RecO (recombination protein O)
VQSSQAIVLRRHRLTETSLIVTWLAPELGRLKTVAKGALRPRNRLGGVLDLFHLCEIQFQTARSGDLHVLREAVLLESFPGLRTEFTRVGVAAYAVELIERATEKEATQKAVRHLEAELSRLLGVAEPGIPAAVALEGALQRLPPGRQDLLHRLPVG